MCVDLMTQQAKEGHNVAMLWPGQMRVIRKKTSIKNRNRVVINSQGIQSYEIINPLPISLDEGIANFDAFIEDAEQSVYGSLLVGFQPDVIHVHTLMGLHKGFLEAAKEKNIRLVFTAHDFFPICPKVTMFRHGTICCSVLTCRECGACNTTALSMGKIHILQSPVYRKLKDFALIKKIRKQHRDGYLREAAPKNDIVPIGTPEDYKSLRAHYCSLLKMMDMVHYNSSVTKRVYESVFELPNSCVINITHADIADNRVEKQFSNNKIRIRYLGPNGGGKGFFSSRRHLMSYGEGNRIFV